MNDKKAAALVTQNSMILGLLESALENVEYLLNIEYQDICSEYTSSEDRPRFLKEEAELTAAIALLSPKSSRR